MNFKFKISRASQKNNIVAFYLYAEQHLKQSYVNFAQALLDQTISISENGDGDKAHIQLIEVVNHGVNKVLILNGEQLVGNKLRQNRIVASTTIIEAYKPAHLEVHCGEQKRWSRVINEEIQTSDTMFFSRENLSNQRRVWEKIGDKLDKHNIKSFTMSADEVYKKRKKEVDDVVSFFAPDDGAIGVALGNSYEIASVDIFSDPKIFKSYFSKILRGYATSNLKNINKKTNLTDKEVYTFLRWVQEAGQKPLTNLKGNVGKKILLNGTYVVGNVLYEDNEVVHCSAFVKDDLKHSFDSDRNYKVA